VQQIRFGQDRAMGYDRNRLVYQYLTGDLNDRYATLRNQLLATGVVASLTRSGSPMTIEMSDTWDIQWEGKAANDRTDFARMSEDEGLVRTTGLQILQGRDMDLSRYPTDSTAILLNESAAKAMGFGNPIGQTIRDYDATYHVVGVIKDFLMGSPYDKMQPMIIEGLRSHFINVVNMRLADGHSTAQSLEALRKVFQQLNPDFPFEYHFVDDDYALKFADTQAIAILAGLFAGLTIFISCLGLFGLAAYMAEARIKEIGVRKVLGASVLSITSLLTREFVTLVFISFVVASPLAWFAMNSWLQNFEYRIHISVWIFVLAGGLSILISLLTVGYQAIAAARANPAKSLRPE
jgi:putative ABC transport system permease protein